MNFLLSDDESEVAGFHSGHWSDDPEEREAIRDYYLGLINHYEEAREDRAMILLIE